MKAATPMRSNALLNSTHTLALLTGLYPAFFFLSNNWFVIGLRQGIYLLLALTLSSFVVISLAGFVLKQLLYRKPNPEAQSTYLVKAFERGLLLFLSCYLLIGFMQFTLITLAANVHPEDLRSGLLLVVAILFIVYLVGAGKSKTQWLNPIVPFNFFLLMLTLISFGSLSISVLENYHKIADSVVSSDPVQQKIYANIQFKSTPNIYLIIPDSYPSNPLLSRFFNFDNSEFSRELSRAGFRLYDDYFSSYPYSVQSMHSMFSMEHNYFRNSIGEDTINMRKVIAGQGNAVTSILADNGYKSIYLHESNYLVQDDCFIESCLPKTSEYDRFKQNLSNFYFFNFDSDKSEYNVGSAMKEQIEKTEQNSGMFIYKHFMDAHSGLKSYEKRYEGALETFRRNYPARIEQVNGVLLSEIRQIISKDKTAIIVIVADHGTWAGALRTEAGLTSDEALDKVNVFLAIRWGVDYQGEYDHQIKTSVNLFRYIFAFLSDSEQILATKAADDSYVKYSDVWRVVQNGKVLQQPTRYDQKFSE